MCRNSEITEKLSKDIETLRADLAEFGSELSAAARRKMLDARDKVVDAGADAVNYAKQNPAPVVGGAALFGLAVGLLIGLTSRK